MFCLGIEMEFEIEPGHMFCLSIEMEFKKKKSGYIDYIRYLIFCCQVSKCQ